MSIQNDVLSDELFLRFKDIIYNHSGIFIKPVKKVLLSNRIRRRLKALNLKSFDEYYQYLLSNNDEMIYFINVVSTNETYFFRNLKHINALKNYILPELIEKYAHVSIWSAGCSTGEEPYTIAIIADQINVLNKVSIIATDINSEVLEVAKNGIYNLSKLKRTPLEIKKLYFKKIDEENFELNVKIKKAVRFYQHNLMKDPYPEDLNIIFCRNVMIYFDRPKQKFVIDKFYNSLKDDGYLFIGHAESLFGLTNKFIYKRIMDSSVYVKDVTIIKNN